MSSPVPIVSPSFASLLKSALPGYVVIDLSVVKARAFHKTYEALMKRERAIAVIENLPSNQLLVKNLMKSCPKSDIPFLYLTMYENRMIYQPITSRETIASLVDVVKRAVIADRTDCFICYEALGGEFSINCDTCGACPCLSCMRRMFDSGDYKCANCRTEFADMEEIMEMMKKGCSERK